jgi:hypothetical protein
MVRRILAFLLAAVAVTGFVAVAGSQINLDALGVSVTPADRAAAAARDLVGAAPLLALFLAPAFLLTALIAGFALRQPFFGRLLLFALAGAGAVLLVLGGLSVAFPMPVLAAARTVEGAQLLTAAGALGGLVYGFFGPQGRRHA